MYTKTFVNTPTINACSMPLNSVNGTSSNVFAFIIFFAVITSTFDLQCGAFGSSRCNELRNMLTIIVATSVQHTYTPHTARNTRCSGRVMLSTARGDISRLPNAYPHVVSTSASVGIVRLTVIAAWR